MNSAAACCLVMYPVILRNKSRISNKIIDCRNLVRLQILLDLLNERCMTPVQAYEQLALGFLIRFFNLL